ncbi:MAG: macro domain-containing protein [Phycisphaerae bacterium]|nr:macro domain-containing protein [Phycisphaerae bacterium]
MDHLKTDGRILRLVKGDITDLEIEAFVYYAREDLVLGSGWGTSIATRGGPKVQEELKQLGPIKTTEAVVTGAGKMKAKFIVHAAGPKFQEPDTERKLHETTMNALQAAEAKGIKHIAFPQMGAGFYGIPLAACADITIDAAIEYLQGPTEIEEIVFCLLDTRDYTPFKDKLEAVRRGGLKVVAQ